MNDIINIAVCDDNIKSAEIVSETVSAKLGGGCKFTVETFYSAAQLRERIKEKSFDLLFLDIDMPGEDGIEFAARLRAEKYTVDYIFVSNREDRVFESFQVQPFGFVRKSRFAKDITAVLDGYKKKLFEDAEKRYVYFKTKAGEMRFCVDDIVYVECIRDSQTIRLASGESYVVSSRMNIIEPALEPYGFIRVHSGYMVNFKFVKRFRGTIVVLTTGEQLPISRRRLSEVKQLYMKLISRDGTIVV